MLLKEIYKMHSLKIVYMYIFNFRESTITFLFTNEMSAMAKAGQGPKPAARDSNQFSHLGGKAPTTSTTTCCFLGSTLPGSWSEEPKLGVKPRYLGCRHHNQHFKCCDKHLSLLMDFKKMSPIIKSVFYIK